ncbi:MAG: hypothetical protein BWY23_02650 [Spirochaetes bacterium ADurb.Bin218]|nr:MAG: hypothetical protein BWY23_02650 [Spirochaetes bacterium ADurb.Bin218]
MAFRAFKNLLLCLMSSSVKRICPTLNPSLSKACLYSSIKIVCPTAAKACFCGIESLSLLSPRSPAPEDIAPDVTIITS